jgi:hypothetical protein
LIRLPHSLCSASRAIADRIVAHGLGHKSNTRECRCNVFRAGK